MFSIPWRAALVAAALTHPTWAPAQRADPSDPRASVPALSYTSAFAAYRALAEQSVGSWREANEKVERAGGWRAYAKEARERDTAATGVTAVVPAAADARVPAPALVPALVPAPAPAPTPAASAPASTGAPKLVAPPRNEPKPAGHDGHSMK